MESVLHIELLHRNITPPATVGFTEYITYGEREPNAVEETDDDITIATRIGSPLDSGPEPARPMIKLAKTFEYMPDLTRPKGDVFTETLHYLKDGKYLVPLRTKIHSGYFQGSRFAHLPSLNSVRADLSGVRDPVATMHPEIVQQLLQHDGWFQENRNHPAVEWVSEELLHKLTDLSFTDIRFNTDNVHQLIQNFVTRVKACSKYDLDAHQLKSIAQAIMPTKVAAPVTYQSGKTLYKPVHQVRRHLVHNHADLRSFGKLDITHIPNLEHNPYAFYNIAGLLDRLPVTDLNIDIIVDTDCEIRMYHENIVANRFAVFDDNDLGAFSSTSLIEELLDTNTLRMILKKFHDFHVCADDDVKDLLHHQPVKLKIIKTIEDEALILLFPQDSDKHDDPLCGVYFDIALQSLAPLTVLPEILI